MIRHVQQTNPWNCGSAVVSMVTGVEISLIEDDYRSPAKIYSEEVGEMNDGFRCVGLALDEISFLLFRYGIIHYQMALLECCEKGGSVRAHPDVAADMGPDFIPDIETWIRRTALKGHATITGVKSKLSGHWVVFYDEKIFDPLLPAPMAVSEIEQDQYVIDSQCLVCAPHGRH